MRIKATKTSLYKLVAEYAAPPSMRNTAFVKAYRSPSYWLKWSGADGYYEAYFSACIGRPLLAIEIQEYDEESGNHKTTSRKTYTLTVEDLRGRGMIDEKIKNRGA